MRLLALAALALLALAVSATYLARPSDSADARELQGPDASLSGILSVRGQPLVGARVTAFSALAHGREYLDGSNISETGWLRTVQERKTDAEGHFQFERLRPDMYKLHVHVEVPVLGGGGSGSARNELVLSTTLSLEPGEEKSFVNDLRSRDVSVIVSNANGTPAVGLPVRSWTKRRVPFLKRDGTRIPVTTAATTWAPTFEEEGSPFFLDLMNHEAVTNEEGLVELRVPELGRLQVNVKLADGSIYFEEFAETESRDGSSVLIAVTD